jgi:hypothetical protein
MEKGEESDENKKCKIYLFFSYLKICLIQKKKKEKIKNLKIYHLTFLFSFSVNKK